MSTNMKWEDMVEKYPDRWVAVGNAVMDGPNIVSGDVVAVKTDDEICDYEDQDRKSTRLNSSHTT